jgi:hypothetical protein
MSEKINPTAHTTPAVFLINTMAREAKGKDLLEYFRVQRDGKEPPSVTVELKINGVEVDFSKSVTEMWARLRARHHEDILEQAKELVSNSRLEKLNDIIQLAEFRINNEIEVLFNEKFGVKE